jgi:hypothetical protein
VYISLIIEDPTDRRIKYRSVKPLVHGRTELWRKGTYPEAGIHIIQCPFSFELPPDAPSSLLQVGKYEDCANVSYGLDVLVHRTNLHNPVCHVRQMVPVQHITKESEEEVVIAWQLKDGWQGPWTILKEVKTIRRGFTEQYSTVQVQVGMYSRSVPSCFANSHSVGTT